MVKRQVWIGVGEVGANRPTETRKYIITSEEDLVDIQADVATYIADDYLEAADRESES